MPSLLHVRTRRESCLWTATRRGIRRRRLGLVSTSPAVAAPPSRLRLAPHAVVLRRDHDQLQVGVQPAVVVPDAYAPLIDHLAGGPTLPQLVAHADHAGLGAAGVVDLVRALHEAGLLQTGSVTAGLGSQVVRLVGCGSLGARTVSLLAAAGVGTFHLADLPSTVTVPEPVLPPTDRVGSLVTTLQRRQPGAKVHRLRHWAKPEGAVVDLTVVAADGPEPDRLVTETLLGTDQPHLVLRSSGDEVVVGPLVVPGATACLRCTDLARRDADPRWPWVLAQLTRVRLQPVPSLLAWGSACAAAQALAQLTGEAPQAAGHTFEMSARDHAMRLRRWPAHVECGCRWPGGRE